MMKLNELSGSLRGSPASATSATMWRGIENSYSANPSVTSATIREAAGPGTRKRNSWRSPMKVSDCQSTDWLSVSKILSRSWGARASGARSNPAPAAGHGQAVHCTVSKNARTRCTVSGRGSLPLRRSKTKRGSPTASRPKRVGAVWLRFRNFSTSRSNALATLLLRKCDSAAESFPTQFLLSRHIPITMKKPC